MLQPPFFSVKVGYVSVESGTIVSGLKLIGAWFDPPHMLTVVPVGMTFVVIGKKSELKCLFNSIDVARNFHTFDHAAGPHLNFSEQTPSRPT